MMPWVFDDPFSYERYVDWVLDVPMFFIKREGKLIPTNAPFRHFLEHGLDGPDGTKHHAVWADWELHLSTVFPEVRLKPFVEIRGADSVGSRWVCSVPALLKGVFYDRDASLAAWKIVEDLEFWERLDLWKEARVHALHSERVRGMCERLVTIARAGLERLDVRDHKDRTEARFLIPLEEQLAAGQTPADVVLEGETHLGRDKEGRLALVRAFHFAGAEV
jgi:glutamate--cysteine ligase